MPEPDEYVPARPHPALAGLVARYGGYREHSAAPLRRRQAPTATCTLILGLDPPLRLHGPAGPVVRRSFLAGMHDAVVVTEFTGDQAGVQVDLTPLGAHVLLGRPLAELTNLTPALDELGVDPLRRLPDRLAADDGWPARFARVDETLLALAAASRTRPDPEVARAWHLLTRTRGRVGIAALAAEVGWSRRRLLRRFTVQVGLGPKTAARVLRFRHAADLLAAGGRTVADVAALTGHADQSHLVREFRALAGCPPTRFTPDRIDPFVQDERADLVLRSPS
ncbi:helix-turn-helix domain-containing protein [Pseudonocardia sp.]|uniref:helix-turn-helix domain-containing protein n=1 Tax=Pseudonocardia sp. TaxID=60912 RepID=UPI003D0BD2B8